MRKLKKEKPVKIPRNTSGGYNMKYKDELLKELIACIRKDDPGVGMFTLCIDERKQRKLSEYWTPIGQPLVVIKIDEMRHIFFLQEHRKIILRDTSDLKKFKPIDVSFSDWDDIYLNYNGRVSRSYSRDVADRMNVIAPDLLHTAKPYIEALKEVGTKYETFYEELLPGMVELIEEDSMYKWKLVSD